MDILNAASEGAEPPIHHRVRRLDPASGKELWEYYWRKQPTEVQAAQNQILLQYRDEIRVLKFLAF